MNDELTRKLPFSMIAEQSLLGAILIDPESIRHVADIITADDFYIDEHRHIYLAMHELFMTDNDIDIVTLLDMLVKKGIYNRWAARIIHNRSVVPGSQNIKDYARIVKKRACSASLLRPARMSAPPHIQSRQDLQHILYDDAEQNIPDERRPGYLASAYPGRAWRGL